MDTAEIIKTLRNFRRKWRREITREHKFQQSLREQYPGNYVPSCYEKSVGIDIGYGSCTYDVDKLIRKLENESKQRV
jgi:hypothetical protein